MVSCGPQYDNMVEQGLMYKVPADWRGHVDQEGRPDTSQNTMISLT